MGREGPRRSGSEQVGTPEHLLCTCMCACSDLVAAGQYTLLLLLQWPLLLVHAAATAASLLMFAPVKYSTRTLNPAVPTLKVHTTIQLDHQPT
jgi:hypothetical protein